MGAQKKWTPLPDEKKKTSADFSQNVIEKAEIEKMKRLLSEKIKDPRLAKKAAMIIAEMINPKD